MNKIRKTFLLIGILILLSVISSITYADVIVATVENNGSCAGLLNIGDRIVYLNDTPIFDTSDVHDFISKTAPNQTILITTERGTVITKLGGISKGKLGIGITGVNRTKLFDQRMGLPQPDLPNSTSPQVESGQVAIIGIILLTFSIILVISVNHTRNLMNYPVSFLARGGTRAQCLFLFLTSFILRGIFNLAYFAKFGWHSTNVLELWFYADVASGNRLFLHPLDPTIYVLRLFSLFSPEKTPFYSTVVCSVFLASLVPVLVYFLVKDLHGPRAGMFAGLIYGFMVQPLALSTVSFTHHLTQIPISILFLISVNRAIKNRGKCRLAYVLSLVPLGILGYFINVEIFIYMLIGYVIIAVAVVRWLLGEINRDTGSVFAIVMLVVGLMMIPAHIHFDDVTSLSIGLTSKETSWGNEATMIHTPNIQFVTALPLPPVVYLRFYGIFAALLPFGVYACWKRRDLTPFLLLLVGILVTLHWTRGSRIMDIGVAMLAGMALTNLKREWNSYLLPAGVIFVLVFTFFLPISYLQTYLIISMGALLAIVLIHEKSGSAALVASLSFCLAVSTAGLLVIEMPQTTQAEYDSLAWLGENSQPGERILTSLDKGHMPPALTSLVSVSDESDSKPEIAKIFFETEELAAANLVELNITYVMVSSNDLILNRNAFGQPIVSTKGYITFDQEMRDQEIPLLLLFRLTYPDKLTYFEEINVQTLNNSTVRIYRVRKDLVREVERYNTSKRVTLSAIIRNNNDQSTRAFIPVMLADSSGFLRMVDSWTLHLEPREVRSIGYDYELKRMEGLELMVKTESIVLMSTDFTDVEGHLYAERTGLYDFEYSMSGGHTMVVTEFFEAGRSSFKHEIVYDGPIIEVKIKSVEGRYPTGPSGEIVTPPLKEIPLGILLAQID